MMPSVSAILKAIEAVFGRLPRAVGPSSSIKESPFYKLNKKDVYATDYFQDDPRMLWSTFPRETQWPMPKIAEESGYNVSGHHGTGKSGMAIFDKFRLPENELGVHMGSPRAAREFTGSNAPGWASPRTYPLVGKAHNPLELPDLGKWSRNKIYDELTSRNYNYDKYPQFSVDEIRGMKSIGDIRDILSSKGYDSVKYRNMVEDPGHMSYLFFKPSPVDPEYVAGLRSPFAAFDKSKEMFPNILYGGAGAAAATPSILEYVKALRGDTE